MRKKKEYSVETVLESLKKKRVAVSYNGLVYMLDISSAENLGNKSWGKIDYLMKYHHFQLFGRSAYLNLGKIQKEESTIKMRDCIMKTKCIFKEYPIGYARFT